MKIFKAGVEREVKVEEAEGEPIFSRTNASKNVYFFTGVALNYNKYSFNIYEIISYTDCHRSPQVLRGFVLKKKNFQK